MIMFSVQYSVVVQSQEGNKRQAATLEIPQSLLLENIVPYMDDRSFGRVQSTSKAMRGLLSEEHLSRKHQVLCSQNFDTLNAKCAIIGDANQQITQEEIHSCIQFVENKAPDESPNDNAKDAIYALMLEHRHEQTNVMSTTTSGFTCLTDEIFYNFSAQDYIEPQDLASFLENTDIQLSENTLMSLLGNPGSQTYDNDLELANMIMKYRLEPSSNRLLEAIDDRITRIINTIDPNDRINDYWFEGLEVRKVIAILDEAVSTFNAIANDDQYDNIEPIELPQHVQALIDEESDDDSEGYR